MRAIIIPVDNREPVTLRQLMEDHQRQADRLASAGLYGWAMLHEDFAEVFRSILEDQQGRPERLPVVIKEPERFKEVTHID